MRASLSLRCVVPLEPPGLWSFAGCLPSFRPGTLTLLGNPKTWCHWCPTCPTCPLEQVSLPLHVALKQFDIRTSWKKDVVRFPSSPFHLPFPLWKQLCATLLCIPPCFCGFPFDGSTMALACLRTTVLPWQLGQEGNALLFQLSSTVPFNVERRWKKMKEVVSASPLDVTTSSEISFMHCLLNCESRSCRGGTLHFTQSIPFQFSSLSTVLQEQPAGMYWFKPRVFANLCWARNCSQQTHINYIHCITLYYLSVEGLTVSHTFSYMYITWKK